MKRTVAMVLALLLTLAGCGEKETMPAYQDGVYTAAAEDYDEGGWKDYVEITISGGKITTVEWDSRQEDGTTKKALSKAGGYNMVAAGAKSQWYEQAASMENALVNEQSLDALKVGNDGYTDAVSGVTIKVNGFILLAQQALELAK